MQKHGISPEIIRTDVDETLPPDIGVEQAVMYLALKKALCAETLLKGRSGIIIAADTVVFKDRIIGKPADENEAAAILRHLRGSEHRVVTGAALIDAHTAERRVFFDVTKVFFKDYTDNVIADYIATGEVWDKAGGYAIQGGFAPHVDHIEGDYENVVGFPWTKIRGELNRMGCGLEEN